MAPLVASRNDKEKTASDTRVNSEWKVKDLIIPEFSYNDIFDPDSTKEQFDKLSLQIIDHLLSPFSTGLIKIIDLPAPNMEDELKHINTIVLKKLFGSVFDHPVRAKDTVFAVSTRGKEKRQNLPNYDTNQVLFPHTDHAFYHTAAQVEGESENTFVSVLGDLRELKEKHPAMYRHLSSTPLAFGRQSTFYGPNLINTVTDTAITTYPASNEFKSFRWHPNLIGSLLCPYEDYKEARLARLKVQELIRSEDFQLKLKFRLFHTMFGTTSEYFMGVSMFSVTPGLDLVKRCRSKLFRTSIENFVSASFEVLSENDGWSTCLCLS